MNLSLNYTLTQPCTIIRINQPDVNYVLVIICMILFAWVVFDVTAFEHERKKKVLPVQQVDNRQEQER